MTDTPNCSLQGAAMATRVAAWREVGAALLSADPTPTGADLRYRLDPGVAEKLATLVRAEAACCPDLRLVATLTLRIDAPAGMREWVRDTFVTT